LEVGGIDKDSSSSNSSEDSNINSISPKAQENPAAVNDGDKDGLNSQGDLTVYGNSSESQRGSADSEDGKGNLNPQGDSSTSEGVDVDLTSLSGTMVFAEVYNIMSNPNDYIGKTIKVKGPYYASYFDDTGLYYNFIIVEDATACCQQGLEFIWNGEHTYPDDYPKEQTRIEVAGVYASYDELGHTYYHLLVDDISVIE
jgi:hypothetical protein